MKICLVVDRDYEEKSSALNVPDKNKPDYGRIMKTSWVTRNICWLWWAHATGSLVERFLQNTSLMLIVLIFNTRSFIITNMTIEKTLFSNHLSVGRRSLRAANNGVHITETDMVGCLLILVRNIIITLNLHHERLYSQVLMRDMTVLHIYWRRFSLTYREFWNKTLDHDPYDWYKYGPRLTEVIC